MFVHTALLCCSNMISVVYSPVHGDFVSVERSGKVSVPSKVFGEILFQPVAVRHSRVTFHRCRSVLLAN